MNICVLSNVSMINLGVNKILVSIFDHKVKKKIYIMMDTYSDVFVAI